MTTLFRLLAAAGWLVSSAVLATGKLPAPPQDLAEPAGETARLRIDLMQRLASPHVSLTRGTVTIAGQVIHYEARAGTLVLNSVGGDQTEPEVAMSYIAYFKVGAPTAGRPITFIYNGGPGESSIWLHMGAWGPKRVVTTDAAPTPAAPYRLVNNDYSLLDATDLVFIDMPGTGFGRLLALGNTPVERREREQRLTSYYWSIDGDAQAFAQFITQFLSVYDRWNSPKYLFGESYGTTRSAILVNELQKRSVDLNGVMLLSTVLSTTLRITGAEMNPDVDMSYVLALPTYAATAWYHRRLPKYNTAALGPLLEEVTAFATTEYAYALGAGAALSEAKKRQVADRLHDYTGLPTRYVLQADLRVSGGMFEHELLRDTGRILSRLDTRFTGPAMDPLNKVVAYDPQHAAIAPAFVGTFNEYARTSLRVGQDLPPFRSTLYGTPGFHWNWDHKAAWLSQLANGKAIPVMVDLAGAMKYNPDLKVLVLGGLYDLATPFYTAVYEMQHLAVPETLQANIEYAFFPAGHMVYAHVPSLKRMHDIASRFIDSTRSRPP